MSSDESKITENAEDLSSVGVTRIGRDRDFLYLKCFGCGRFYEVPVGDTHLINWFACPDPRHKHHKTFGSRGSAQDRR